MLKLVIFITFSTFVINAHLFSVDVYTNAASGINQLPSALVQIANALEDTANKLPKDVGQLFLLFTSELKMLLNGTVENLKPFHDILTKLLTESDKLLDNAAIIPLRRALYELKDNIFQIILASTKNVADVGVTANEKVQAEIRQTLQLFVKNLEPTIQTFGNEYEDLKKLVRTIIGLYANTKRVLINLAFLIPMFGISCYLFYRNRSRLNFIEENQNFYTVLWTMGMTMPCLVWSLSIIMFDPFYESILLALVVLSICFFLIISSGIVFVVFVGKYKFFLGPLLVLLLCLIPFIVRDYSPLCAIVVSPYRHKGDNSYYYLLQTSNWIEGICPNVNQQLCPLVDLELVHRDEHGNIFLVDRTLQVLRTLPSPLFIHSEIGDSDTGKSIRQTIVTRLIIKSKYRQFCSKEGIQFFVRDTRVDPGSCIRGVTRGISVMIIPSSWIDYDQVPYNLKQSMAAIRRGNGTLLIVDTEGANEHGGLSIIKMRILQLLAIGISSHVSIATKEHINKINMKEMASYALLMNMLKAASNSQCGMQQPIDTLKESSLFTLPSVSVLPKRTDNLVPFIGGINYSWEGDNDFVTHVEHDNSEEGGPNIDLTHIFWANVTKLEESDLKADVQAISLHFKNIRYLVNFPPYPKRNGLFSYPNELNIYKNSKSIYLSERWNRFDDWYGNWLLPKSMKPPFGLTYSLAHYVLPAIFSRMSPKQISNKLASGFEFVELIQDLFRLLNVFDHSWLEALGAAQIQKNVCDSVQSIVQNWEKDLEKFQKALPVEGQPPCKTKELCSPDFEQKWEESVNGLYRSLCMLKLFAGSSQWDECHQKHVDPIIHGKHTILADQNERNCSYRWKTGEFDTECNPKTCPGYRHRSVYCVSSKTEEKRPDECCNYYLSDGQKPSSEESCDIWTYSWSHSTWGSCSEPACGIRDRIVQCKRCDGLISDYNECLKNEPKPPTSEACNPSYEWKSRGPASCPCGTTQHREVWCEKCGRKDSGVIQSDCEKFAVNERPSNRVQCPICPPPPRRRRDEEEDDSCFSGETLITMHDKSEKPIKQVTAGDYILTPTYQIVNDRITLIPKLHSIARVAFVEQRKLGQRSLYGINNIEPFFTSEHIFMMPNGQAVSVSPVDMSIEDPSWSVDDVKPMTVNETILFNLIDNDVILYNLTSKSHELIVSNVVYTLILDSVHQFYANGFVVSDLFPQLHKFPFTFILFHWLWREKSVNINRYLNESFPTCLQSFSTDDIHLYPNINLFRTKLAAFVDEFISNQTNHIN